LLIFRRSRVLLRCSAQWSIYLSMNFKRPFYKLLQAITLLPKHLFYSTNRRFERFGSDYGFIAIPKGLLYADSVVYSIGAGEDLLADVDLCERLGCTVHIVDPTPKAEAHFKQVLAAAEQNKPISTREGLPYKLSPLVAERLRYITLALWKEDTSIRFYEPENPDHISHSITNVQHTDRFIEVPATRLATLMERNGHAKIDFIKIDIEGAEYAVLDDIMASNLDIKSLYIEYHADFDLPISTATTMTNRSLSKLVAAGYRIYYSFENRCFGLIKN
jgi:FkbM family methyltransferase